MSEVKTHLNRLTAEGKVSLRAIAGQLIGTGQGMLGRDWRSSHIEEHSPLGAYWWVEDSVFIDEVDDVVFTGRRYYRGEFEAFIADRLANDDVWFSEVAR